MNRKILIAACAGCLACGAALAQTPGTSMPREPGYQHYIARLSAFDRKFAPKTTSTATQHKSARPAVSAGKAHTAASPSGTKAGNPTQS
jgi:hypothetical protein